MRNSPKIEAPEIRPGPTMYGGKHIAEGDTIFIFASENEGGPGLSDEAAAFLRGFF